MGTVDTSEERVVLSAADQFTAVFKNAQRSVDDMKKSVDSVKGALGALGVTVGAGALVQIHYDALKATAALDDMAESTGASVEMLSAIQRVARVGGQDFEGLTGQIGKMVKGLKQGGEEGTKAGAAFGYLDIKTKDVNGRFRDTGQIVVELAGKLSKYEDGGNKVALVQDALGKGAERYLPLLKDIAEKTDLHATVTARQAAQAEEAEKNMRRLQLVMADARRELVVGFTPAIIEFTEKLLMATKVSGGLVAGVATMATAGTGDIGGRLKEINEQLEFLEKTRKGQAISNVMTMGLSGLFGGVGEGRLVQEREYLEGLLAARKNAAAKAGAADPNSPLFEFGGGQALAYQSPDVKKHRGPALSPYASEVLQMQQRSTLSQTGESEFMKMSLAVKAGKFNTIDEDTGKLRVLTEAEKKYLLQLAAAADTERNYKELRDEKMKADEKVVELLDAEDAKRRQNLQTIQESFMTEDALAKQRYDSQLEMLRQSGADQEQFNEYSMRLYDKYQEDLTRIHDDATKRRYQISQVYRQLDMSSAGTFFGYMSGLMKTKSRELFEIGKVGAIAETTINTYRAATGAYAALAGIPIIGPALGIAAAAAAVAAGLANVAAIQSQSYGSAGGGAVGTFPASPATGLPVGAPTPQAAVSQQSTIVHLHGDNFGRRQIQDLLEQINEAGRDGGRIVLA